MNNRDSLMKNIFSVTCTQKIMEYLAQFPGRQFVAGEIQNRVKISKGGVNQSLRELAKEGFVNREKKSKIFLYSINHTKAVVKQFKILKNIELLRSLTDKISEISDRIVLFGSSARGEDSFDSDLDIFILTKHADQVNSILKKYRLSRKLQTIVRVPVDYANMERKEPVFFEEINRGVVIWENKE